MSMAMIGIVATEYLDLALNGGIAGMCRSHSFAKMACATAFPAGEVICGKTGNKNRDYGIQAGLTASLPARPLGFSRRTEYLTEIDLKIIAEAAVRPDRTKRPPDSR
ncbi:MAG TPA: hypothetical protein VH186_21495 [Chloroflexia bacterium]|nr:hypothetical protein [Chloroflexia bacterium]